MYVAAIGLTTVVFHASYQYRMRATNIAMSKGTGNNQKRNGLLIIALLPLSIIMNANYSSSSSSLILLK